jgi:hypothetical protein
MKCQICLKMIDLKVWSDMSDWEKFRDMIIGLLTIIALIFFMGWIGKV